MQPSPEIVRQLTEPPSAEQLQRVARELYEIEPLILSGKYGDGETVIAWGGLSDDARRRGIVASGPARR